MKSFAALIDRLETARDNETAARALADWLAQERDPERGVALAVLLGVLPIARAGRSVVAALAERLDPTLLAIGREVAGELAETIALMWPAPTDAGENAPTLAAIAAALSGRVDRATLVERLVAWLDALGPAERVALLRLATGHIAGMLPARVAQDALARLGGVPLVEIEAAWHAVEPPYEPLFAWLERRADRPSPTRFAPFRRLTVVTVGEPEELGALDPTELAADAAWDGLRVLAVSHGGTRRLYSRRGVDVGERFPDLLALLEDDVALEGVVLVRDAGGRFSGAALETRLGRRPNTRTRETAVLMLHDVLEHDGDVLRGRPLRERREALETISARLQSDRAALSPLLPFGDWSALASLRRQARGLGAAGVVLKPWNAPYTADTAWIEVRCEPVRFAGVLLYIEWASQLIATVGAWDGDALVPVAKVVLEDSETASLIARYVSDNAVDRFGPVMQARADAESGLVLEVAFDAIERAPRRKAGVLLRGARLVEVLEDRSPKDAVRLDELRALLR